jgi:FkbH-like protein
MEYSKTLRKSGGGEFLSVDVSRSFDPVLGHQRLVGTLTSRLDELIDVWQRLGPSGPTNGAAEAGTAEAAREGYLHPLARAFVGALNGSRSHAALYFDERLRYVDRTVGSPESLRRHMATEFSTIAEVFGDDLPSAGVEQELWEFHEPLLQTVEAQSKVLFIGDCLFVETRAFLVHARAMQRRQVDVRHVFFSTRQPLAEVNTAIVNEVRRYRPHLIGLSLFTFEGVPPYAYAWRKAAMPIVGAGTARLVDGLVRLVDETIADIRTVSDAPIALHIPCGVPLDKVRRRLDWLPAHSRAQRRLLSDLSRGLHELAASVENVVPFEENEVVAALGGVRAASASAFAADDVPPGYSHTTALGPAVAQHYDDLIADYEMLGRAKALFVDFDNTLWSGVMGEGDVEHDLVAQQLLLDLKNAGVLLVALSKNDEASIRWDEMLLSESDFALTKINWQPKPDNASAAIRELDLAPDAFVLLDDNPVERAMLGEMLGVHGLDSGAPETWRALRRWLAFPSTRQTDEARKRTVMYREAAERRAAVSEGHNYESMMSGLRLRFRVAEADASDLPRVMELIERTNQFNTTTRRFSLAEVEQLTRSERSHVYAASLRDRFGDLGVVAVAIFGEGKREFESVIMSCRAMGFGLEFALLRVVMDAAGPGPFRGLFVPTERNGPAAELFPQAGFRRDSDGNWVLDADEAGPQVPTWLHRE